MENQVKVAKSDLTKDQMPARPPSYLGPPNLTPSYETVEYNGCTVAVQPAGAPPVILASALGIEAIAIVCYSCNERVVTRIERLVWFRTHFLAGLLCLMGCWPCVPIPYCTDVCKKAIHYCPNCNAYIGTQL